MKILAIDTANKAMTVGLVEGNRLVAEKNLNTMTTHSVILMPAIETLFEEAHWLPRELDRIVCVSGPGSYTGIRIAVTTAKMLAFSMKCPLVEVSSLQALALNVQNFYGLIVPIIDARRGNVYAGAYCVKDGQMTNALADVYASFEDICKLVEKKACPILFIGETEAFEEAIKELPQASITKNPMDNYPRASLIAQFGAVKEPVQDIHSFVPNYLKNVEAVEKWLETQKPEEMAEENYVEKI